MRGSVHVPPERKSHERNCANGHVDSGIPFGHGICHDRVGVRHKRRRRGCAHLSASYRFADTIHSGLPSNGGLVASRTNCGSPQCTGRRTRTGLRTSRLLQPLISRGREGRFTRPEGDRKKAADRPQGPPDPEDTGDNAESMQEPGRLCEGQGLGSVMGPSPPSFQSPEGQTRPLGERQECIARPMPVRPMDIESVLHRSQRARKALAEMTARLRDLKGTPASRYSGIAS